MPRAKASKKVVPVAEENGATETVNGVSEEIEASLNKPKGRGVKKTKGDVKKAIELVQEVEQEPVGAEVKPKKVRGPKKVKQSNDDQQNVQEDEQTLKPPTKGKGKPSNVENGVIEVIKPKAGRNTKKAKEPKSRNVNENEDNVEDVNTVAEPTPEPSSKSKTGRVAKQPKNLPSVDVKEEISSSEKVAAAQPRGQKRKLLDPVLQNKANIAGKAKNLKKDAENSKEVQKRGRGKKQEVAVEPEEAVEDISKKKAKIGAIQPAKTNEPKKKSDEQKAIVKETETKKTKAKEDKAENSKETTTAPKKPAGRKRVASKLNDEEEDSKPKINKILLNLTETAYNKADFELNYSAVDGNISNASSNGGDHQKTILKISSWNVAGLRSWLKKGGLKYLEFEEPDIFCIQEIKCKVDQLPEEAARIPGYHPYWLGLSGNYGGVALYSKIMPINVEYGIGNDEFDGEGHIITAEYEKFYLINVYVPNSGRKLVKLEARMRWEKLFQAFVKRLDALKPVIISGDMNVSHNAIDLANPKTNTRSAGFTVEEREKMTELLALGFVDTYRHLYPKKTGAYTFWTYLSNSRSRNIGWRLDYFLVSERIIKRVVDNVIRSQCLGSDHCPITLFIKI